jgi:hypothetical protein
MRRVIVEDFVKKKKIWGSSLGWAGSSPIEAAIFATLFELTSSPTPAARTGLPPTKTQANSAIF